MNVPPSGAMVGLSSSFQPAMLKGLTIHADNPLRFDFIVDKGDSQLKDVELKTESTKLVKYFLTSLTIPEKELWVNLSPYEKERIVPEPLGQTLMGRDMLAQDYLLKQLSSSLMHPESKFGKEFWKKIYSQSAEKYGNTNIPVNTFNKIWIAPDKVVVYEHGQNVFIVRAHLKVMLDRDYLATEQVASVQNKYDVASNVMGNIIKEIILPAIEKEVNEGKAFSEVRQIYRSMILATWFKRNLNKNLLARSYVDRNKINGVDVDDKNIKQKIYDEYIRAFKKGAYNFIKEDIDPLTHEVMPRKYFSGGVIGQITDFSQLNSPTELSDVDRVSLLNSNGNVLVTVDLVNSGVKQAQSFEDGAMSALDVSDVNVAEFKQMPTQVLLRLADWIKVKRWFVDKESQIMGIDLGDGFQLGLQDGLSADCLSFVFHLKGTDQIVRTKQYFIPLIISEKSIEGIDEGDVVELSLKDGKRYLSLAENSILFQRAVVMSFKEQRTIITRKGGTVTFTQHGSLLTNIQPGAFAAHPLNVSTSNLVFSLSSGEKNFLFKVYKDMRGSEEHGDMYWPPNMEMDRYEALASAEYGFMPALHGVSYYKTPEGQSVPLMIVMDTVQNEGEVGGAFWFQLSDLLEAANVREWDKVERGIESISGFSRELARTIAKMHVAFSKSRKNGFMVSEISSHEVSTIVDAVLNRFTQGVSALKARASVQNNATLDHLISRLEAIAPYLARGDIGGAGAEGLLPAVVNSLHDFDGALMKMQVHGDLSGAQGLIESTDQVTRVNQLLEGIRQGNNEAVQTATYELASRIRWIDFEGEPAKDTVEKDHDTRQNSLVDVASFLQGLWYTINVKVYVQLGLDPQNKPEDKETARKISLVLAGQLKVADVGIKGFDAPLVEALTSWLNKVSDAFIDGYLDEVEAQGIQSSLLNGEWDRNKAKFLVYYWALARAFHELRYETYARDWGWEAIPVARILQIVKEKLSQGIIKNNYAQHLEYATQPLQVVSNPPSQNRFFSAIDAGRREDVIFFPFQHMRAASHDPQSERYDWGNGDFVSAKSAIDFCNIMGIPIMQILPIQWSAAFHSPYSILSNQALDPENINIPSILHFLKQQGIVPEEALRFVKEHSDEIERLRTSSTIDHETITNLKLEAMKLIWATVKGQETSTINHDFLEFERQHQNDALEKDIFYYLAKQAGMQTDGGIGWEWRVWDRWFPGLSTKDPVVVNRMKKQFYDNMRFHFFVQFLLERQWNELVQYGDVNNVRIMNDIPFAPADSTVFHEPELVSMDSPENGFQRLEVQGVPGKKETPLGQVWQFTVYNNATSAPEKYFKEALRRNQKRGVKYLRFDHVPGFYQVFAFRQDVHEEFTLEKLGIAGQFETIRINALKVNTPEARHKAGLKVLALIKETLMNPPAGIPKLPKEIIDLLFTENGNMRTEGNMLMIARKIPKEEYGKKLPAGSLWTRVEQVEDKIFKDQPFWDFLRITPNKRAADQGFIETWLFPEKGQQTPMFTDSIRVAYYRMGPGERLLQDLEYFAQREGNTVILETLGNVTNEMLASSQRPGGYPLIPLIWGLDPKSRYHPLKYQANNFSVYGVADSQTPVSAWQGETLELKEHILKLFNMDGALEVNQDRPTPEVYDKLLSMVMAPQEVFPELSNDNVPLLSGLSLLDYLMLDDSYRLNVPGRMISWLNGLPADVSLATLLLAAKGENSSVLAQEGVTRIHRLRAARYKKEPVINPAEVKLLNTRPNVERATIEVRRIDATSPDTTNPFLIEAIVQGVPKSVSFVAIDRYGKEFNRIPMQEMKGQKGSINGVGDWMVSLRPVGLGVYRYFIEIGREDGSVESSKPGVLVAADSKAVMNYLSPDDLLKDIDTFREDRAQSPSKAIFYNSGVNGGISFDPAMMDMQVNHHGSVVMYDDQVIQKTYIQGLTPVIIDIKAVVNLPLLLGFSHSMETLQLSNSIYPQHGDSGYNFMIYLSQQLIKLV